MHPTPHASLFFASIENGGLIFALLQFTRTVSSYSSQAPVLVALFKKLDWNQCRMISNTQDVYLRTAQVWRDKLKNADIQCLIETFESGSFFEASPLQRIKREGLRVIVVLAESPDIARVCLYSACV